jgi:alpha-galactosidase
VKNYFAFVLLAASLIPCFGQTPPAPVPAAAPPPPPTISADVWKSAPLPFSFKYDGKDSASFLSTWTAKEEDGAAPDGHLHRYIFTDPASHLKVVAEVRTFDEFDAVDWVLNFTNEGTADTPIIEDIEPLHWTMGCDSPDAVLHANRGSSADVNDFSAQDSALNPNSNVTLGTGSGRSSDFDGGYAGSLPFFNLQTGGHGLVGAIGWTGSWRARFDRDTTGNAITLTAGMQRTHLLLHPGETIRTPRILLMNWKGDQLESQNTWRQLMLAEYTPKDLQGKTVVCPICWDTWGTERAAVKLDVIKQMAEQKIPADAYWMDAGWYEPITLPPDGGYNTGSPWSVYRGDWIVSKNLYPDGFKPIGEALKQAGIGYLVWFEAETANGSSKRLQAHPDWYLLAGRKPQDLQGDQIAFLNLGNPDAFKDITDQISGIITDGELTWYRQDYNFAPAGYWATEDKPDRVGMSEIKSITGLYAFWDELRKRHPGLQIDNCASGGRRLDIETCSRSVALWRSDNAGDPIGEQHHTMGLMPWIPLTAGVWWSTKDVPSQPGSPVKLYEERSAYSAGLTVCTDMTPAPWLKTAFDEFHEVRPYYAGDYYSLLPNDANGSLWAAWQLQMRDGKSGVAVVLRRPASPYSTVHLDLHGIDGAATYDVEIRTGQTKGPSQKMSGNDLANRTMSIEDRPGSALIFYSKE